MNNRHLLLFVLLSASFTLFSQSVEWVVKPVYDAVEVAPYGFVKVISGGKTGLVATNGTVVVPAEYENITDFREGKALVADKATHVLKGVVYGNEKTFSKIEGYAVDDEFPYFSDGRLAVMRNGKWGFLNENLKECAGALACGNESVLPFSEGCTFIKINNTSHGYFNTDGTPLMGNFKSGLVEGYSYNNGKALTFNSNLSWSIVDKNGNVLVDIKAPKQKFMPSKNGNTIVHAGNTFVLNAQRCLVSSVINGVKEDYGENDQIEKLAGLNTGSLSLGNGYMTDILFNGEKFMPSQFEKAIALDQEHVAVCKKGKWGIVKVINGSKMSISLPDDMVEFYHSTPAEVSFTVKKPANLADKRLEIDMTDRNNNEVDKYVNNSSNNVQVKFRIKPRATVFDDSQEVKYKVTVDNDDIRYLDDDLNLTCVLREGFSISCSKKVIDADSTGFSEVNIVVKNKAKSASASTRVSVSWDDDSESKTETFAPGKSLSIPVGFSTKMSDDYINKTISVKVAEDGYPTITRSFKVRINRYIPEE